MRRWLSHIGSAALSLLLAVTVWLVAVREENPRDWFSEPVSISRAGLPENLTVFGEVVGQVRVEIRAPKQRWRDLQARDFTAWLDLANVAAGEYDVRVQVKPPGPEVQVLSINPSKVRVRLEEVRLKSVPVRVNVLDAPAFGFDWQSPVISPTQVTVSGSTPIVDQVESAAVDLYLRGARSTVERTLRLTPRNTAGEPISLVTLAPKDVLISVPVLQLPGYREAAILVEPFGRPASGYTISGVSADPKLVMLFGDPAVISGLSGYITVPVDISDAKMDVVERVPLHLPENITALGTQSISVLVDIQPIAGAQTIRRRPVIQGLAPGLTYTLGLESVNVFLSGPVSKLDELKPDAVPVILDLTGMGPGVHAVEPKVPTPEGIKVEGLAPQTIEITIGAPATSTPTPTATIFPGAAGSRSP
jgi:YbbR domain-containing protein